MNTLTKLVKTPRLYRVLLVMMLVLAGVAWSVWQSLGRVSALAERTDAARAAQLTRIHWVELNVTNMSLQLRQAIESRNPIYLALIAPDLDEKGKLIEDTLQALEPGLTNPLGRDALAQIKLLNRKFLEACDVNLRWVQDGKKTEALKHLLAEIIPLRDQLLGLLAAEKQRQSGLLEGELDDLRKSADGTRKQLALLAIAVAVGLSFFYWYVADVLYRSKRSNMNMPRTAAGSPSRQPTTQRQKTDTASPRQQPAEVV
jgi:methyl-accepting chemotaxis protein